MPTILNLPIADDCHQTSADLQMMASTVPSAPASHRTIHGVSTRGPGPSPLVVMLDGGIFVVASAPLCTEIGTHCLKEFDLRVGKLWVIVCRAHVYIASPL